MRNFLFFIALFSSLLTQAQTWVDETYRQMTLDEKLGQLFMVGMTTSDSEDLLNRQLSEIQKYRVGGVAFLAGSP